jgi:hypothetical protein
MPHFRGSGRNALLNDAEVALGEEAPAIAEITPHVALRGLSGDGRPWAL